MHATVATVIPSKLMPRFERGLLADLDLVLLKFVECQVKYRAVGTAVLFEKRRRRQVQEEKKGDSAKQTGVYLIAPDSNDAAVASLTAVVLIAVDALEKLVAVYTRSMAAWFYKYLQFQLHLFSAIGEQVMSLQDTGLSLASSLRENGFPQELDMTTIVGGDVAPEIVLSPPGWGNTSLGSPSSLDEFMPPPPGKAEQAANSGGGSWFENLGRRASTWNNLEADRLTDGGEGDAAEGVKEKAEGAGPTSKADNAWLAGMFQRRNLKFGGDGDHEEAEAAVVEEGGEGWSANPWDVGAKRRGSGNNNPSRRASKGVDGAPQAPAPAAQSPLEKLGQLFLAGSNNSSSAAPTDFATDPFAAWGTAAAPEKRMSGVAPPSTNGEKLFAAFGVGGGRNAPAAVNGTDMGDEWVDFMNSGANVEFDANM